MSTVDTAEPPLRELVEEHLPPAELAQLAERGRRFETNLRWFERHAIAIGRDHPGKFVCVAGGELFVGDDPRALRRIAAAAHPDDDGAFFSKYILAGRRPLVHAYRR